MKLYAGIDLHSSNNYLGIINEENKKMYQSKLPNQLHKVGKALEPFKEDLRKVWKGMCLLIMQAEKEAGELHIEAVSEGLASGELEIITR